MLLQFPCGDCVRCNGLFGSSRREFGLRAILVSSVGSHQLPGFIEGVLEFLDQLPLRTVQPAGQSSDVSALPKLCLVNHRMEIIPVVVQVKHLLEDWRVSGVVSRQNSSIPVHLIHRKSAELIIQPHLRPKSEIAVRHRCDHNPFIAGPGAEQIAALSGPSF